MIFVASMATLPPIPFTPIQMFAALGLINAFTIWRFYDDKRRAVAQTRRISEANLLFLALIGGSPGAFYARHRFRHKTRKQPFSIILQAIAGVQVGAGLGLLVAYYKLLPGLP